jgi:hypothetical protein
VERLPDDDQSGVGTADVRPVRDHESLRQPWRAPADGGQEIVI